MPSLKDAMHTLTEKEALEAEKTTLTESNTSLEAEVSTLKEGEVSLKAEVEGLKPDAVIGKEIISKRVDYAKEMYSKSVQGKIDKTITEELEAVICRI